MGGQELCNRGHQWELCHDGTSSNTSYCQPSSTGVMVSVPSFKPGGNNTTGSGYEDIGVFCMLNVFWMYLTCSMYFGCMYSVFCMRGLFCTYVWQAWYIYVNVCICICCMYMYGRAGCPARKCVYLAKSAATA